MTPSTRPDPARAETRPCAARVARPAAVGRHRVERSGSRAPPALRQCRGLCGRDQRRVLHPDLNVALRLRRACCLLNVYNVIAGRSLRLRAAAPASLRRERRRDGARDADPGRAACYVVWTLGITSDLHVYYMLAGAALFFFGVQNWKLFLVIFVFWLVLLLFALNFAPIDGFTAADGRALARYCCRPRPCSASSVINAGDHLLCASRCCGAPSSSCEQQNDRSEALIATVMPAAIADAAEVGRGAHRRPHRDPERDVRRSRRLHRGGARSAAGRGRRISSTAWCAPSTRSSERHGVEKIKTIGDSYMAAAGFDGRAPRGRGRDRPARARDAGGESAAQPPLGGRKLRLRDRHPLRPGDRGRHRRYALLVRRVGRCRELAARMECTGARAASR